MSDWRVLIGDVLDKLAEIPDESVQCVVTSPPYWGLRDYGVEGMIGLEPTLDEHLAKMVEVFREVRRVLRSDGTCWLNYGDAYSNGGGEKRDGGKGFVDGGKVKLAAGAGVYGTTDCGGLAAKQRLLLPHRVALALQDDGWWVRSEIVWAKGVSFCPTYSGSCMPSPVRDRPTDSHEFVFLLTKAARYFYDGDAVREANHTCRPDLLYRRRPAQIGKQAIRQVGTFRNDTDRAPNREPNGRNLRTVWTINPQAYSEAHFACVDEETECLTQRGWLRHDQITTGDVAAQYNPESGSLSWGEVLGVARYDVTDQEMVRVERRDVDMMLTPNHRCYVFSRRAESAHVVRADALRPDHRIPVAAPWEPSGEAPCSPEFAELLGWWVAEGWTADGRAFLCQSVSANPDKVRRIADLIAACEIECQPSMFGPTEPSHTDREREWRGRPSVMRTWRLSGLLSGRLAAAAPDKTLPWSCASWAPHLVRALIDGLVGGDGHTRPDDGRRCFVQKSKHTADVFHAMAVRLGYAARLSHDGEKHVVYMTDRATRSLRGTGGAARSAGDSVRYTGVVWCPSLPHGTFVARRRGRVFITGNTYPERLVEPCLKAGTSERGACSECGAPWRRVVEVGEKHTGWGPTCDHTSAPTRPCLVLDPFNGSGTTGAVAVRLGLDYVGIELNPEYAALAHKRIGRAAADVGAGGDVSMDEDPKRAQRGLFR